MSKLDEIKARCEEVNEIFDRKNNWDYAYSSLTWLLDDDIPYLLNLCERQDAVLRWYAANCACACGGSEEMQAKARALVEAVEGE